MFWSFIHFETLEALLVRIRVSNYLISLSSHSRSVSVSLSLFLLVGLCILRVTCMALTNSPWLSLIIGHGLLVGYVLQPIVYTRVVLTDELL